MALSYDPGNRGAIAGLSQILERRGDWEQLSQIFEARTETGTAEERAEALRALARMAQVHGKDAARAESTCAQRRRAGPHARGLRAAAAHLRRRPGAAPRGAWWCSRACSGSAGRTCRRVIELGRRWSREGDRRWAWCVLSPLMNSTLSEPQLKANVLELRKEFEKSDNTSVAHARAPTSARARPASPRCWRRW